MPECGLMPIGFWVDAALGTVTIGLFKARGSPGGITVLEGELVTELKDGRSFILRRGMSYQVATDAEPHRSSTPVGAKLFIVD